MPPQSPETLEFRAEFAAETDRLLRRRLRWFIAIWGGLGLTFLVLVWTLRAIPATRDAVSLLTPPPGRLAMLGLADLAWFATYGATLWLVTRPISSSLVIRLSLVLIFTDGVYGIAQRVIMPDHGFSGPSLFVISHIVASLVFPWTLRQAVQPILAVAGVNLLSRLLLEDVQPGFALIMLLPGLIAGVPGSLIAWFRHSRRTERFAMRFWQRRYGSIRQELASARRIHEALFPKPTVDGPVGLTYGYEPMRQLGGDFIFSTLGHAAPAGLHAEARRSRASDSYSVVLLDVTGHGIPAALTVNRLHGEIELMYAENPDASPAEVISHLNRYVHLTLAKHSIYVTGVCVRVRPELDVVEYVNAGHPPAFLRAADGTVHELASTTFLLGACAPDAFDPAQEEHRFLPGDSLIAYTDGATEAKTLDGQMLRIQGMRRLIARPDAPRQGEWPRVILEAVTGHRGNRPPEDDTLLVEVFRPVVQSGRGVVGESRASARAPAAV